MNELTQNILYYGREESLPERTHLRAGPLSLVYEAGDLRAIRLGEREILRRVYAAVRDHNWDTVPMALSEVQMDVGAEEFHITYRATHVQGDVDFTWRGTIQGDAQGTITFILDGEARSSFRRNRMGFCVLHPMQECAGQPCRVEKVDGTVEEGRFPRYISPHQPFMDMRAITYPVVPGLDAKVRFAGDVFEMEDQRNWTDASFKTYCTPLGLPFPVEVQAGTRIRQSVTLSLHGPAPALPGSSTPPALTFQVGEEPGVPLARIGLGTASHGQRLSQLEVKRLRALNLSHLRVDLTPAQAGYVPALYQATAEARALGIPLQIALHLSGAAEAELQELATLLREARPPVHTWLIFHQAEKSTTERWIHLARQHLSAYDPAAFFGAGTDAYFTELNRERPPVQALELVCYSLNPQVHAFDNTSLVETLPAQAVTVESARLFAGSLPIAVTPVTLAPRFNPNATGPEPEPAAGELPPQVDVRQMSLLGAAWTAGSLKYLVESGVEDVTYYETSGWRGVMETAHGSPLPDRFPSLPGAVFPLYHVLADVGEFQGGQILRAASSAPLRVDGLVLRKENRMRILLANMTSESQQVALPDVAGRAQLRRLDERNAVEAMYSPETYRSRQGERVEAGAGGPTLELLPYALICLDLDCG